ncbi:succinylglutamate-semialdehyde dehydrogenase [Kordiimonas sp. SCSIO 12610]|uniref:succinylglutamate-semialdehyde dehydrogenase n=1 Tax=Kordiimonas sp. SCSIO 12610 TaxID=2829597 RepID=UPI00210CA20A|nr:succinylglutamate-semialdehyde dehydrogenase [Kordiimonas sp. SCSIO 12610]UTW55791.1 succinylglutamate-semialdehyde dehydrogenase [Kordiimonas sp. SCSIO 12610]
MSLYINGEWVAGEGANFTSVDPSSDTVIWEGQEATKDQVEKAVHAAAVAFETWSLTSLEERIAIARKYSELLAEKKESLAELIAKDAGKVMWDALGEAGAMINKIEISVTAYEERTGSKENVNGSLKAKLSHRPHGVMAVFGPYNFPGHLPNGHIVPALIAGNTIVFKPSEITPAVAEVMVKTWEEAGLPQGVLNLVQGGRDVGVALVAAKAINGLLFTGSAKTGQIIARQLVDRPEVIQALELGGNNPLIVTDVKDNRAASVMTVQSAFISSGQRCTCARRLIVPEGEAGDAFIDDLLKTMDGITVGSWNDTDQAYMGPVVSAHAADLVLAAQQDLLDKGAKVLREVQKLPLGEAFLSPGLIDVTGVDNVPDEEVFGPMLQLIRVKDFDAAIKEANNTRFGLAAGLISDNADLFEYFFPRSRAGIVNWNQQTTGAASTAPFGGIGLSGNHRPSAYYAADYCSYAVASMEQAEGKVAVAALPTGLNV